MRAAAEARIAKQVAEEAVAHFGLPRDIDPHTALLDELHRTYGHVCYLAEEVRQLQRLGEPVGGSGYPSTEPVLTLRLYQAERKHLTDVAKICIAVGIEEHRVKLDEERGRLIAELLEAFVEDLGLPWTPTLRRVLGNRLRGECDPDVAEGARAEIRAAMLPSAPEAARTERQTPGPDHERADV